MTAWQDLAAESPYKTAVSIKQALDLGQVVEASSGLTELIDALSRSERRALKSQLARLMLHVIKWRTQPQRRSRSWVASIGNGRDEITDIREETPSLNETVIADLWDKAFVIATREAEAEMGCASAVTKLSWKEVFEEVYRLDGNRDAQDGAD